MTGAIRSRTRTRLAAADDPLGTDQVVILDANGVDVVDDNEGATIETDGPEDPDTARLRKVLNMLLEGRTQKEIAAHFGKSVRTIRRWIREATRRKLALTQGLAPEQALADFLYCCTAQSADLRRMKSAAEAKGDLAVAIRCNREILRHETTRMAVLEKLGLFNGLTLGQVIPDGERPVSVLIEAADRISAGGVENGRGGEDQGGDDDDEPIF